MLGNSNILGPDDKHAGELAELLIQKSSVLATVTVMPSGRLLNANSAFLALLGVPGNSALLNCDFRVEVLANADDWRHWELAMAAGHARVNDIALKGVASREVIVRGDIWSLSAPTGSSGSLLAALVDDTRTKRIERTLQQAARNEAISSLAGGLIHDFRNLLTVLVGNLSLITEGVRDEPKLLDQAKRARDVARRGADLTQQLLSLSREDDPGSVALASKEGEGTRIELLLPASAGTAEDSAVLTMPLRRLPVGRENVLIVAPDQTVSKTIEDSLLMLGYSIFASADPAETMRLIARDDMPLVIVDASAGGAVDPRRLAEAIRQSGTDAALLIVGTTEHDELAGREDVGFLRKPFSLKDLASGVRAVLDRRASVSKA